jgi:DNA/RNA-binding domain of Phe-tRNA-synthetase-like protein
MAKIKNMLLTAGHDLDSLELPIWLEVTRADEVYTQLRGQPQPVKPGDMIISDGKGIMSNIDSTAKTSGQLSSKLNPPQ